MLPDGSNNLNENRLVSGSNQEDDHSLDNSLRPRSLDSYVGQDSIKSNLGIGITAAQQRGEPLDHLLLSSLNYRSQCLTKIIFLDYRQTQII